MKTHLGPAICLGVMVTAVLSGCSTVKKSTRFLQPAAQCETMTFPIYFRTDSDALTDEALQAIRLSAGQAKDCRVEGVRVLGLADSTGAAQQNLELSQRRARTVAAALKERGLPEPSVDAAGDTGSRTAAGAAAPGRRRTEVMITFSK